MLIITYDTKALHSRITKMEDGVKENEVKINAEKAKVLRLNDIEKTEVKGKEEKI